MMDDDAVPAALEDDRLEEWEQPWVMVHTREARSSPTFNEKTFYLDRYGGAWHRPSNLVEVAYQRLTFQRAKLFNVNEDVDSRHYQEPLDRKWKRTYPASYSSPPLTYTIMAPKELKPKQEIVVHELLWIPTPKEDPLFYVSFKQNGWRPDEIAPLQWAIRVNMAYHYLWN